MIYLFRVGDKVKKSRIAKASKKRLVVFGTLSIFIICYFIFTIGLYLYNIGSLNIKKDNLNNNLKELKREEKKLTTEIEKLQDHDYIAKYAREHYSYSKNGEYIITTQVLNTQKSGDSSGGGSGSSSVVVYETKRKSIHEALRDTIEKVPNKLYIAHLELVLISEEAAKKNDILATLDFFLRDNEGGNNFMIVIAKDDYEMHWS